MTFQSTCQLSPGKALFRNLPPLKVRDLRLDLAESFSFLDGHYFI